MPLVCSIVVGRVHDVPRGFAGAYRGCTAAPVQATTHWVGQPRRHKVKPTMHASTSPLSPHVKLYSTVSHPPPHGFSLPLPPAITSIYVLDWLNLFLLVCAGMSAGPTSVAMPRPHRRLQTSPRPLTGRRGRPRSLSTLTSMHPRRRSTRNSC